MRFEFEWGITETAGDQYEVHERLVGTDLLNRYAAPTMSVAQSIIRARREFVRRTITSRLQAQQIFEPRPNLEALRLLQKKGHLDS